MGGMIDQHLAAGTARRDDRRLGCGLFRLRLADGDDGCDFAVTLDEGPADGDRLGTDRKPANRCAEMQAGEDVPAFVAHRRGETVALGMKMLPQLGDRRRDQAIVPGC